jgi:hypothetical protein
MTMMPTNILLVSFIAESQAPQLSHSMVLACKSIVTSLVTIVAPQLRAKTDKQEQKTDAVFFR